MNDMFVASILIALVVFSVPAGGYTAGLAPADRPIRGFTQMPVDSAMAARQALARKGIEFTEEAFVKACENGEREQVSLFLTGGMDPNARNQRQLSCLVAAAHHGDTAIADLILSVGSDPSIRDHFGATPMMHASSQGFTSLVERLLSAGADVSDTDSFYGWTALIFAAYDGHAAIVSQLLDAGADPDYASAADGYTALLLATHQGHADVVELLVGSHADVSLTNNLGQTALDLAQRNGFLHIAGLLEKSAR